MSFCPRRIATLLFVALALPRDASAIPAFARKYGVSCMLCHSPVPRLNSFGAKFAANGFEFAKGEEPRDTIATGDALLRLQRTLPLAVRFDGFLTAWSGKGDGKAVVDFQSPWVIKLLSGGQVADKVSYYMYFLLAERGEVGGLEDAYLQFTDVAGSGVSLILGQFQVSDPLFKRELRLEYEDYRPLSLKVGESRPDLTYERGAMAFFSPWKGSDVSVQLVNGQGLAGATADRRFDRDTPKNVALRVSQEAGRLRLGGFGYYGSEKSGGVTNATVVWGPDATITLGEIGELNALFLRRTDDDPFFGSCTPANPCPGGATRPFGTAVSSAFVEAIFWPNGPTGRVFVSGLYNWVDSDKPVVALGVGESETAPGYLKRYQTVSGGVHYVFKRNVRMMLELGWDVERQRASLATGTIVAF